MKIPTQARRADDLGPQPARDPRQHDGRISDGHAQDDLALGKLTYCATKPLPLATASLPRTSNHCPHDDARPSTPTGILHRYASNRWCVPPAYKLGHPGLCARPNDQLCWTVSSQRWYPADDANAQPIGELDDEPLLCNQPATLTCQQPTNQPTNQPSQPAEQNRTT